MPTDIHCPECGSYCRREQDGLFESYVCTNDDCPRIIATVTRRPADEDRAGGRNTMTRFADLDEAS